MLAVCMCVINGENYLKLIGTFKGQIGKNVGGKHDFLLTSISRM